MKQRPGGPRPTIVWFRQDLRLADNPALLFEPSAILNKSGKPFQVFTPFWKHCLGLPEPAAPVAAPRALVAPARWPRSRTIGYTSHMLLRRKCCVALVWN